MEIIAKFTGITEINGNQLTPILAAEYTKDLINGMNSRRSSRTDVRVKIRGTEAWVVRGR